MSGHSVRGFVPSDYYDPDPFPTPRRLGDAWRQREDQRLVRIIVDTARLPFPVTVVSRPDVHALEVRVPGHALATVTQEYVTRVDSSDQLAVHLGRAARRAWFRTPALPLPDGVQLGEN